MTSEAAAKSTGSQCWFRSGAAIIRDQAVGEGVVFDPLSGETNFLSELPSLVLSVIDDRPSTAAALVERLAGPLDLNPQAQSQIVSALLFLEDAELVESQAD